MLIARGVAVDRKRITQDLGIAIEALADDAVTGGVVRILRTVRFPGNDEAAVAEPRDRRVVLIIMRVGADQELTTKGFAAVGIALAVNVVVTAIAVAYAVGRRQLSNLETSVGRFIRQRLEANCDGGQSKKAT